ncbi:serine/threonine-protein kinase mos [Coccinella septempunctata]|uniref:serine/threonine-protein kinase mos n=1 Tax=Coccinella septempunctata TaxID=41139 RepID=UPI001D079CB5|nr:serine/threonine-protein kinase mos [Coccinella septempunctata]
MATPKSIKSVAVSLVKNTLSPRNPAFLEVPSPKFLSTPEKRIRSPVSRKCLNFSPSQNGQNLNALSTRSSNLLFVPDNSKNNCKKSILIDTPTKSDLMKNGLTGRKTVMDILGKGSFGTVVKGSYRNSLVAVKITKGNEKCPSDVHAKGLRHENIVQVLDIIMKPKAEYAIVIMEYLEGSKNLQSVIDSYSSDISEEIKKKFIQQICLGLQFCHLNGILHLDLKPKNILVLPNDQCKICDFGNSCKVENTKNYIYQGTVAYAAPELLRGHEPTEKCDLYSLGITIWQLEYKKNPYENWSSSKCLVYNVVKYNVRPVYEHRNDVITKIFVNCWSENPFCRPELKNILRML